MARLTNALKDQIIDAALDKAAMPERCKAIRSQYAAWAEAARIEGLGGPEAAALLDAVEVELRDRLKSLPRRVLGDERRWLRIRSSTHVKVNVSGRWRRYYWDGADSWTSFEGAHARPVCRDDLVLQATHPLSEQPAAIDAEASKLKQERDDLRTQVRAALVGVNTVKRLLVLWPEADELLPKDLGVPRNTLPMVQVEQLNRAIGLPSGY